MPALSPYMTLSLLCPCSLMVLRHMGVPIDGVACSLQRCKGAQLSGTPDWAPNCELQGEVRCLMQNQCKQSDGMCITFERVVRTFAPIKRSACMQPTVCRTWTTVPLQLHCQHCGRALCTRRTRTYQLAQTSRAPRHTMSASDPCLPHKAAATLSGMQHL